MTPYLVFFCLYHTHTLTYSQSDRETEMMKKRRAGKRKTDPSTPQKNTLENILRLSLD